MRVMMLDNLLGKIDYMMGFDPSVYTIIIHKGLVSVQTIRNVMDVGILGSLLIHNRMKIETGYCSSYVQVEPIDWGRVGVGVSHVSRRLSTPSSDWVNTYRLIYQLVLPRMTKLVGDEYIYEHVVSRRLSGSELIELL